MIKYQKALNKIVKSCCPNCHDENGCSTCDIEKTCNCTAKSWVNTLQEIVDKYNAIQEVYFKNEPMEGADLNAIKLQELYNFVSELIEKNQKLKDKETPKKIIIQKFLPHLDNEIPTCPKCGLHLMLEQNYCDRCGQALDWSKTNQNNKEEINEDEIKPTNFLLYILGISEDLPNGELEETPSKKSFKQQYLIL